MAAWRPPCPERPSHLPGRRDVLATELSAHLGGRLSSKALQAGGSCDCEAWTFQPTPGRSVPTRPDLRCCPERVSLWSIQPPKPFASAMRRWTRGRLSGQWTFSPEDCLVALCTTNQQQLLITRYLLNSYGMCVFQDQSDLHDIARNHRTSARKDFSHSASIAFYGSHDDRRT